MRAATALMLCALAALVGCAAHSYAGIPLAAGAADPALQTLARRAQAGDKGAQLELGILYEEGRGVPADLERAERLYRRAATTAATPIWVYSPPVGGETRGSVVNVGEGEIRYGLAEAQERLDRLRQRLAVRRDR